MHMKNFFFFLVRWSNMDRCNSRFRFTESFDVQLGEQQRKGDYLTLYLIFLCYQFGGALSTRGGNTITINDLVLVNVSAKFVMNLKRSWISELMQFFFKFGGAFMINKNNLIMAKGLITINSSCVAVIKWLL